MNVQLGKYKGFGLKRPHIVVTIEEIDDYIFKIREKYQTDVEKEGSIKKGDYVVIEYDGYHGGEHIPQISSRNHHSKIGEGYLFPKFEDQLLGMKRWDKAKFDLVLGSDYQLDYLQGETVHFEVKVLSVMNRIVPELTDDVVKNFKIEGINTIVELKDHVKNQIHYEKMNIERTKVINEIMHRVIEGSRIEFEDEVVKHLKDEIFVDFKKQLEEYNASLEIYLSYTKITEEELLEQCKLEAETYLREKGIIEKIMDIENITLSDKEKEQYEADDDSYQLLLQKVVQFLLKENTSI